MRAASARRLCRLAIVGMLALGSAIAANAARAMDMIESTPKVNEIMEGKATAFAVRFDHPVSHRSSRLILVTPQGSRTLPLRLRTEPDTLYANVGPLPPGKYELQWDARAVDGTESKGSIPFTIQAK